MSSLLVSAVATCLLILALSQQTKASGVFELEFIKLEELDLAPKAAPTTELFAKSNKTLDRQESTATAGAAASSNNNNRQQPTSGSEEPANFVRVLVCLKEAFTSQLDGPCTFGNASITLRRDSMQRAPLEGAPSALAAHEQQTATAKLAQQGSQLTNIVRILFTFRWTKSFTIILTAEQLQADAADGQQSRQVGASVSRASHAHIGRPLLVALRHAGSSMPADSSANQMNSSNSNSKLAATTTLLNYMEPTGTNRQQQNTIDRHILTENEVLPNLEPNPNKPWANRFSRSLKSSLAYRFRVYCSLNYYGDGCTTFCRPRDDQFGHYNCSSTGQKVCLDGWSGADCDKAKCRAGCNQQHGYCEKPDTCQCRPGWTGARCDECLAYPGCQNGYCLSPWQCICQRNWGGVLCDQDLNYCGTHEPCKNNGTCQNIAPGRYKCLCPDGFAGVDCDINLSALQALAPVQAPPPTFGQASQTALSQLSAGCALNPCLNGGTCFGFNSMLTLGFGASAYLEPSNNLNNLSTSFEGHQLATGGEQLATADQLVNADQFQYRCQCAPGWTGDYCQWSEAAAISVTSLLLSNASSGGANVLEQRAPNSSASLVDSASSSSSSSSSSSFENKSNPTIGRSERLDQLELDEADKIARLLANSTGEQQPRVSLAVAHSHRRHEAVDMRRLISGVVVASAVGVFLAALAFAWCCLVAIGRNKFSFIQMNIIRSGVGASDDSGCNGELGAPAVASTLRRMHEKIRDSLRRSSRSRIRPDTKLNIENVLKPPRPPPSYEESRNNYHSVNRISIEYPPPIGQQQQKQRLQDKIDDTFDDRAMTIETHRDDLVVVKEDSRVSLDEGLVIRGALEQKLASFGASKAPLPVTPPVSPPTSAIDSSRTNNITNHNSGNISSAQLSCPRHGHLYRQQSGDNSNNRRVAPGASGYNTATLTSSKPTTITIKQSPTYFHHLHSHHHSRPHYEDHDRDYQDTL